MMKKILIIAYHYPPDLAVGAIRPAKFAKYLPDYGFEPVVLTVDPKYYSALDQREEGEVGEKCEIHRTVKLPNFRDLYLSLKAMSCGKSSGVSIKKSSERRNANGDIITESPESITDKLKRYFNSLAVWLPDDKTGWVLPATIRGLQLIRTQNIEAIYTTGPPHSVHLIGLLLKQLTGRIWVADFRDPWIGAQKPSFVKSKLSEAIEKWLEQRVVAKSDFVVSVTPEMTRMFQNRYPEISLKRFVTIYNGFDSEELAQYKRLTKHSKITFTYAGSFYLGRDPENFLRSLSSLIKSGIICPEEVVVKFIGNCRFLYEKSIEKMVEQMGLQDIVLFVDQIPRNQVLAEMAKSHALLLLAPDQPLQIPGKLYEYMGLNSFILAVCGPGATSDVLQQYPKACVVSPNNQEQLDEAVLNIFNAIVCERRAKNPLGLSTQSTSFFERFRLTQKLGELL